ncbi:TRAP transporter substrate-binding protein [Elioraea rosea]|uniref:TRAP transporter substrate-binding protein n=1 Tax=Elioraea rosea TaxID=2492390 RepID=UPI0011837792|nr:TRAP transporter substrate-binding protein [Elioraea rosea]
MNRRSLMLGAAGAGVAASLPSLASAQGARWQFATPYPDGNFHTQNIREFVKDVEGAASGFNIVVHSNASLLRMPEIKRGVQTGQVQMGEILLSAYGNEDPMFEVDGIPMLVTSFTEARVLNGLQRPYVQARLARQGITLLYMVPWPQSGFYTNTPLATLEGLRGTKFRTFNAATQRFATLVGATPTLVQVAELAQAFATGVVNAMVTSAATGVDSQAWDYVKHFVPVGFTRTKNAVFCSTRALNALPAATQQAIRGAAERAEQRGWDLAEAEERARQQQLADRGMTVADPPPATLMEGLRKVGDTMIEEWVQKAGADGKKLVEDYRAAIGRQA